MDSKTPSINSLPTELLQHILQSLPIVELMRCRCICRSWRSLVDGFSDDTWRRLCARDHAEEHEKARTKCSPDLTWRQLYRSLHMWTKLNSVDEYNWIELIRYTKRRILNGVCGVSAFKGQIILEEDDKILYYDSEGGKTAEFDTKFQQVKYDENDSIIVYIVNKEISIMRQVTDGNSELRIVKKVHGEPDSKRTIVIPNVQNFIIVGNNVYYDTCEQNEDYCTVYHCRPKDNYSSKKLKTFTSRIVTYGYIKDKVSLLMACDDIYLLENNDFVQRDTVNYSNSLQMARKYNLQPNEEFLYLISCDDDIAIQSYCFYGNLTFIGYNDATVKVYDTDKFLQDPFLSPCEPLQIFELYEWLPSVQRACTNTNVTGVDIMEKKDGHIIIAAIPKGAFAIELTHKCLEDLPARTENQEHGLVTRSPEGRIK